MTVKVWVMTGASVALAAQAAIAQPDPMSAADANPMRGENFVSLDANGDGVLSRSELTPIPEIQMRFETIDTNKDGTLSVFEFSSSSTGATASRRIPEATPPYEQGSSPQSTTGGNSI